MSVNEEKNIPRGLEEKTQPLELTEAGHNEIIVNLPGKQHQSEPLTSSSSLSTDGIEERERWNSKWDYILSVAGSFIGLGNVWRFPYLCYKHGGGAFLIPYGVFLIFAGIPIFFLEQALGQYTQLGGIEAWNIVPQWKGIGYGSVIICFFLNTYFTVILAWTTYYFLASFVSGNSIIPDNDKTTFPWSTCGNSWNSECCYEIEQINTTQVNHVNSESHIEACIGGNKTHPTTHLIQPAVDFWENSVLKVSSGIEEGFLEMNWPLFACLVGCWVFIYFCLWKGVKSTGKVVWVTATAPFVLIMVFLVRALTLPNAMIGVRQYMQVDMSELMKVETWMDAGTQIFWSFSICLSAHISLGSYNKRKNNVFSQCVALGFLNSFTSFISGFVVFGVLGFMSAETGLPISEVVKGGPGLAFIVYPKAITLMPGAKFWGATFFVMIFLLGIDSQFVCTEGIVTSTCDLFPEIFQTKEARKTGAREKLVLFICSLSLFVGIPMIMRNGIFIFTIFDFYSASGVVLLTVSACQCIAIGWSYGGWKFYDNICEIMGYVPVGGKFMPFAWMITAPGMSIATLVVYFIQFPALEYTFDSKHHQDPAAKYTFPRWTQIWGLSMSAIPAVLIIGNIGYYYLIDNKSDRKQFKVRYASQKGCESNEFSATSSPPGYSSGAPDYEKK